MVKHLNKICLFAGAATILVLTGCHNVGDVVPAQSQAAADADSSATTKLEHTQSASGARADCTLYPAHFDGAGLSSLGTSNLDLVLADSRSCNPLVVYMAVPEDKYAQDRRMAVGRYLEDRGSLKPEQIEFQSGPNPESCNPAGPDIRNYSKTDTVVNGSGSAH